MDFKEIFTQAQKVQNKVKVLHHKMTQMQATGEAGGGVVKATVDGHKKVLNITIDPVLMAPNEKETLQDLIVAAINIATKAVDDQVKVIARENAGTLGEMILHFG